MERNMHKFVFWEYLFDVTGPEKLLQIDIIPNLNMQLD